MNELNTTMIEIDRLKPSPTQPRKHFDSEKHKELTDSMKVHGFTLSTLLVRRWPGDAGKNGDRTFEIVTGERRWRAAKEASIKLAPCIVRELTDQQVLEMQLIENIQREDLTPIEEAQHYKRLLDMRDESKKPLYSYESLALRIGKSARTVREKVQLCSLDEEALREVESGRLPPATAYLIARIPDQALRLKASKLILHPQQEEGPLSARKALELIHHEFIRDLRVASFDQADATLYPLQKNDLDERVAGGACLDCPFKSGNVKAAEIAKQGHNVCLNPACYEEKQKRSWARWQQENTDPARKRRALNQSESLRLYPFGNQLASSFGLVDLNDRPDGNDLRAGMDAPGSWRMLTDGTELDVLVARDRLGKNHELVDRLRAIEAARTINKHSIFKSSERDKSKTEETRKTEEKKKDSDREQEKEIIIACCDQIAKGKHDAGATHTLLRLVIDRELEHSDAHERFFKRYRLPVSKTVSKQLAKRPLAELFAILVEFVVSEGGFTYEFHEQDSPWLKAFGVDYKATTKKLTKARK